MEESKISYLQEGRMMPATKSETQGAAIANINLKVTEDERWAFKEWCARNRMSQVDAFRRAFKLLEQDTEIRPETPTTNSRTDNG